MSEALQECLGYAILVITVGIKFCLFFHGWPKFIVINKYYNDVDKSGKS